MEQNLNSININIYIYIYIYLFIYMRIVMCKIVRPQNLCDKILECQNKKKIKKINFFDLIQIIDYNFWIYFYSKKKKKDMLYIKSKQFDL